MFINHIVFSKASAFEIPSNCLSYKMFTSSSVIASAAFGLFPLPSFLSSLLRASKACLTCSNWLSSITLQGYLQAFKCRLKVQISPLKLEGSKSSPSFLLTAIINLLIYSLSYFGGISSILLLSFLELRTQSANVHLFVSLKECSCFFWSSINLPIGLSGDTNRLDCSAILKNIS